MFESVRFVKSVAWARTLLQHPHLTRLSECNRTFCS
jgi:hypothetical protein